MQDELKASEEFHNNPDHHLWNNNGTWFVHYTVHPTPFTKQRIRASLGTKNLTEARARRDKLLFVATALSPNAFILERAGSVGQR